MITTSIDNLCAWCGHERDHECSQLKACGACCSLLGLIATESERGYKWLTGPLLERLKDFFELARVTTFDNDHPHGPCFLCREATEPFAGNPGRWPLSLGFPGGNGERRVYHMGCVTLAVSLASMHSPICNYQSGLIGVPGCICTITYQQQVRHDDRYGWFTRLMEHELQANSKHKGDWASWQPDPHSLMSEIQHHVSKLNYALLAKEESQINAESVREYAADVANYLKRAVEMYGGQRQDREAEAELAALREIHQA